MKYGAKPNERSFRLAKKNHYSTKELKQFVDIEESRGSTLRRRRKTKDHVAEQGPSKSIKSTSKKDV